MEGTYALAGCQNCHYNGLYGIGDSNMPNWYHQLGAIEDTIDAQILQVGKMSNYGDAKGEAFERLADQLEAAGYGGRSNMPLFKPGTQLPAKSYKDLTNKGKWIILDEVFSNTFDDPEYPGEQGIEDAALDLLNKHQIHPSLTKAVYYGTHGFPWMYVAGGAAALGAGLLAWKYLM